MQIEVQQQVLAGPDVVWKWMTDPARINRWSSARVESLSPDEGGSPDDVGARRLVAIRLGPFQIRLTEVIEQSQPGRRLVYRVLSGAGIAKHRGELTLAPHETGTLVRWEVDAQFMLPGMGLAAGWILRSQLASSLASLAKQIGTSRTTSMNDRPNHTPRRPASTACEDLWTAAESVATQQRALAEWLERSNDAKFIFAKSYQYMTEETLKACRNGRIAHTDWLLRLIPVFHQQYIDGMFAWISGQGLDRLPHWQRAFTALESRDLPYRRRLIQGMHSSLVAHIEIDLPRCLAGIYQRHYRTVCEFETFRADFERLYYAFHDATCRLVPEIPRACLPWYILAIRPLINRRMMFLVHRLRFYDALTARMAAFEAGKRMAAVCA